MTMAGTATPEKRNEKTDAIVVLTGGNFRTNTGLALWTEGLAPELMITGVNEAVKETDIRKLWKSDKPLPDCCITLGHKAKTTLDNAEETKEWLNLKKFKKIRIVTSTYHMQRALQEFRLAMPEIEIIPHPVELEDYSPHEWKFWVITFSEYNKYILRSLALSLQKGFSE